MEACNDYTTNPVYQTLLTALRTKGERQDRMVVWQIQGSSRWNDALAREVSYVQAECLELVGYMHRIQFAKTQREMDRHLLEATRFLYANCVREE
jgi:predicted hydrolase (HD superfamily)